MSHHLGLDSVREKLVLLEHFALGSRTYCEARLTGSEEDQGDGALEEYWGALKSIVSSYLLSAHSEHVCCKTRAWRRRPEAFGH